MTLMLSDTTLEFKPISFDKTPSNSKNTSLGFYNYSGANIREVINIGNFPSKTGHYPLFNYVSNDARISWSNMYADGDVLGGRLNPDSLAIDSNWLEITYANKRFSKIKGHFQAVMKVEYGDRYGDTGARIFIRGEFDIQK